MLWTTRERSLKLLSSDFRDRGTVLDDVFLIMDECIDLFDKKANEDLYHRICGLTFVKARNLSLDSYSLILGGLGQESGALLRPLIEYHELLVYFRLDPSRVQEAVDGKLPSPGKRAKTIQGYFQEFRTHLNEHASHGGFSDYTMMHLVDLKNQKLRAQQTMKPLVLDKNLGDLFAHLILVTVEAIRCLQIKEVRYADAQAYKLDSVRRFGIGVFKYDKRKLPKI